MDENRESILSVDTVKELWIITYNSEGKPDWTHIFPYYHPEMIAASSREGVK